MATDKKYTDRINGNGKTANTTTRPTAGKATEGVTGSNAQQTQTSMEEMMKTAGEQWGENLKNILVSSAISKVFGDIAQGDYGSVGNNYIEVLQAFSEGIEASNLALVASESTTNFLPAGSESKPETASLTVSKVDA